MKRKITFAFLVLMLIALFPLNTLATGNCYYGSGNYVSSASVKPTGLKFYVDGTAITTYGSSAFSVIFNWNGSYKGHVTAVAQYPDSASKYSIYFPINTSNSLSPTTVGQTFYYTSSGATIGDTYPMDSSKIYKCKISLTTNKDLFKVNGTFSAQFLKKTIQHEVGHVFLLKHPDNSYVSSIMHMGVPDGSIHSSTITTDDRTNIADKWGS